MTPYRGESLRYPDPATIALTVHAATRTPRGNHARLRSTFTLTF